MATKIFKTRRVIYRVEQNENGKLEIYREYFSLKKMDHWQKDGRAFQNAASLINNAGGIDALLSQCIDVEDTDSMISYLNAEKKAIRERAAQERNRQQAIQADRVKADYERIFSSGDTVETTAESLYVLLRYLNTQNWGTWRLPAMSISYQCQQYDCDGKTAITIQLDRPVMVAGKLGTKFQYGAPRGHLAKYDKIVDWSE